MPRIGKLIVALAGCALTPDEEGDIGWIEKRGDKVTRHEHEPGAGPLKRGTA